MRRHQHGTITLEQQRPHDCFLATTLSHSGTAMDTLNRCHSLSQAQQMTQQVVFASKSRCFCDHAPVLVFLRGALPRRHHLSHACLHFYAYCFRAVAQKAAGVQLLLCFLLAPFWRLLPCLKHLPDLSLDVSHCPGGTNNNRCAVVYLTTKQNVAVTEVGLTSSKAARQRKNSAALASSRNLSPNTG